MNDANNLNNECEAEGRILPNISATKVAIEICNNPELKREILCLPGSNYNINNQKRRLHIGSSIYAPRKTQWSEKIEEKAAIMLEHLRIADELREKVMGIVLLVGIRILTWAVYHERTFELPREFSADFLNSSFFTEQGIIDSTKAAADLMNDINLTIEQKYKLACVYCFKERIPALFRQVTKEKFFDPKTPIWINQPGLVKFWSYYQMGEVDMLKGQMTLDQYRLEKAVESGIKSAVEFCLEKTNLRKKRYAIVDAATLAVKCRVVAGLCAEKDWVLFQVPRLGHTDDSWVPSDYYVDILFFLLSKMAEDQLIEFLKHDIIGAKYEREILGDLRIPKVRYSRVLDCFLNWPYPCYFMKTARLLWEFLPDRHYAVLLLRISSKIEAEKAHLKYGEGKSYDYRGLLREFWCESPDGYKRYVFKNEEVNLIPNTKVTAETGSGLLVNLLNLQNFTCEDGENIKLILANATCKERENIFRSDKLRKACIAEMKLKSWEKLNRFVLNCFLSKEEEDKFKRELSVTKEAWLVCIGFILHDDWYAAESFIKWSCLLDEEINKLKKAMIYSEDGMRACVELISCQEKIKPVDEFIRWCFPSEEVKAFKKYLVFCDYGICICVSLVKEGLLELLNEFIHYCLPSEGELRELLKNLPYRLVNAICDRLISESEEWESISENEGEEWNKFDQFLSWCFSCQEEVNEFKKKIILSGAGYEIHFNFVKSSKWERAEMFFAWLGLSAEEIKILKKDTLLNHEAAGDLLFELFYSEEGDERFADYGSKQEAIKLFAKWFFTDRETVLEFKEKFDHDFPDSTENNCLLFEKLLLAID